MNIYVYPEAVDIIMGYNRNKRIALNLSKPLPIRYLHFLRCVSIVSKSAEHPFVALLNSYKTGVGRDKAKLSEMIISSFGPLEQLKEPMSGYNGSMFEQRANNQVQPDTLVDESCSTSNENEQWKCLKCVNRLLAKIMKNNKVSQHYTNRKFKIKLHREYHQIAPIVESRSKEVFQVLSAKLKHQDKILAFPLQYRIKTWDSILEKLSRMKLNISSVTEMQDLVGFRIVTVFESDIHKISNIIDRNFNVVRKYVPNKQKSGANFYRSLHIVIDRGKYDIVEALFKSEIKILSEIQVMSLAQFTFAKASHLLHYKKNTPLAEDSMRTLQRTSALLETVDLEFERILKEKR